MASFAPLLRPLFRLQAVARRDLRRRASLEKVAAACRQRRLAGFTA